MSLDGLHGEVDVLHEANGLKRDAEGRFVKGSKPSNGGLSHSMTLTKTKAEDPKVSL